MYYVLYIIVITIIIIIAMLQFCINTTKFNISLINLLPYF